MQKGKRLCCWSLALLHLFPFYGLRFLPVYAYGVLGHETGSWQKLVHEVTVGEVAFVTVNVGHSVPRLDANERRILAVWRPNAHGWRLECQCHRRLAIGIEQRSFAYLAVVEDERVVIEGTLVERPDSVLGLYFPVACAVKATAVVCDKPAYGVFCVELQLSAHRFARFDAWYVKRRMASYLEMDGLVVGVFYVPYHMDCVAVEPVAYGKVEMERIFLERFGIVVQDECDFAATFGNEFEVHVAGEAVPAHSAILVAEMGDAVP